MSGLIGQESGSWFICASLGSRVPEGWVVSEGTCNLHLGALAQEVSRVMAVSQMLKERHIGFSLYRDGYIRDTELTRVDWL